MALKGDKPSYRQTGRLIYLLIYLFLFNYYGLPDDVVLSPTLNSFKGRIDRHWRSLRYSVF